MNSDVVVIQAMEGIIRWVFVLLGHPLVTAPIASLVFALLGWKLVPGGNLMLKCVVLLSAGIVFVLTYGVVGISEFEGLRRIVFNFLSVALLGLVIALLQISHDKKISARSDDLDKEIADRSDYLNAITQLGDTSVTVRMVGIKYLIGHCIKEQKNTYEDATKDAILQIFNEHIRCQTQDAQYQASFPYRPAEDIQKLIDVLVGRSDDSPCEPYKCIDWREAYLRGVNLQGASLQGANLAGARLQEAKLRDAQLQGAHLGWAQLQGASLLNAHLCGASLAGAQLQGAKLNRTKLCGANLANAILRGAILAEAQLQGANLWFAQLQGSHLADAQLQGANLEFASLQGAFSSEGRGSVLVIYRNDATSLPETPKCPRFQFQIRNRCNKKTEVDKVIFEGGVTQEQITDIQTELEADYWKRPSLKSRVKGVEKALEVLKANKDTERKTGVSEAEKRKAHIGTYGEEEAAEWIRRYERVVPGATLVRSDVAEDGDVIFLRGGERDVNAAR